jgi:hypothetical protein
LRVPTLPAVLLAIAAMSAFLANEPLLVVLGHRGRRAREIDGSRAARRLAATVGAAAIDVDRLRSPDAREVAS